MSEYTAVMSGGPLDGQMKTYASKAVRIPERRVKLEMANLGSPITVDDGPVYWEHAYELDESQTPPVWAYKGEVRKGTMREMEEAATRYLESRDVK